MLPVLIALIINIFIIFIASYIVPGVKLFNFLTAVILAITLGIANAFIHQFMIAVGIPTNLWTYGFISIVVSTLVILGISAVMSGLEVDGVKWALIFAFVISVLNALLHSALNYIR